MSEEGFLREKRLNEKLRMKFTVLTSKLKSYRTPWINRMNTRPNFFWRIVRLKGMDMSLCEEVRVADNNGEYEIHMKPGTGNVDFGEMFRLIESSGFKGHYMNGFGSLDDMLEGREYLTGKSS